MVILKEKHKILQILLRNEFEKHWTAALPMTIVGLCSGVMKTTRALAINAFPVSNKLCTMTRVQDDTRN